MHKKIITSERNKIITFMQCVYKNSYSFQLFVHHEIRLLPQQVYDLSTCQNLPFDNLPMKGNENFGDHTNTSNNEVKKCDQLSIVKNNWQSINSWYLVYLRIPRIFSRKMEMIISKFYLTHLQGCTKILISILLAARIE